MFCDHNEKLASGDRKNNEKFVTLIFLFFDAESLGDFFYFHYIRENGKFGNAKNSQQICLQSL